MRLICIILLVFISYRLGNFISVPFMINSDLSSEFLSTITKTGVLNQKALQRISLFSLGIVPYITASIVIQLFKFIFSDTSYGANLKNRKFLSGQTLIFTLGISIIQSFIFVRYSFSSELSLYHLFISTISLVCGCFIIVWFAKVITSFGFGNGASILIMMSIIEHLYLSVNDLFVYVTNGEMILMEFFSHILYTIILLFGICYVELSFRPLKLVYPSTKFRDGYNKNKSKDVLPLKINNSGVLPLIFALSFSTLLSTSLVPYIYGSSGYDISPILTLVTLIFITFFVFFYTPFVVNTEDIANNLKKSNIILENRRPGTSTKNYLDFVINNLNYLACFYLGAMIIIPDIMQFSGFNIVVTGVSAVILIVVVIDIIKRIQYMSYSSKFKKIVN